MDPNINFVKLINKLRKDGWSDTKIAAAVKRDADAIRNIRVGRVKSVRYDTGVRLLQLHSNVVAKQVHLSDSPTSS